MHNQKAHYFSFANKINFQSGRHVICLSKENNLSVFLQKPNIETQLKRVIFFDQ